MYEQRLAVGVGGYVQYPCWRAEVGMIPTAAHVAIPSLDWESSAAIMRDGLVRARLPRQLAAAPGTHEVVWTLTTTQQGVVWEPDAPPAVETYEVGATLVLVAAADLPPPRSDWYDDTGLPTPTYMRENQLFGIPPVDGDNRLLPDEAIALAIRAGVHRVERHLGITLGRKRYSALPGAPAGALEDPGYDFDPSRFRISYGYLRLRHYPVREVHGLELWLANHQVAKMPAEWVRLNKARGDVQILPGALSNLSLPGSIALPIVMSSFGGNVVPHLWRVDYTAGMDCPSDMAQIIGMIASQALLIIISDSTIAGIASQSVSLDGISESIATTSSATNSTYGANIIELEKRIKKWLEEVGPTYAGLRIVVV
jgi:hypothetical protein